MQLISKRLNARRAKIGISCSVLARRTGISLRSVQRILSGDEVNPGFATLSALARELGIGVRFDDQLPIASIRRRQAERKADRVLAIVQGSSALEGQAVSRQTMKKLREKTINELLAGSPRKLWSN